MLKRLRASQKTASLLKKSFEELYETAKVANCLQRGCLFASFCNRKTYSSSLKNSSFSFSTGCKVSSTKAAQKETFSSAKALKISPLPCLLRFQRSSEHRVRSGNTRYYSFYPFPLCPNFARISVLGRGEMIQSGPVSAVQMDTNDIGYPYQKTGSSSNGTGLSVPF